MSNWIRLIGKYLQCPLRDQVLLAGTFCLMGLVRFVLLTVPFRYIATGLGDHMGKSPEDDPGKEEYIQRITWAIGVLSSRTPWESKCLVQAITAKILLRRQLLPNTLYLGVAKDGNDNMIAHAWTRTGGRIVTGGQSLETYTVVATFADFGR